LRRRNRAGLKRMAVLALALVIALGAMGVGYAAWTDELYINGTVYTGTVDIDLTGCSSTFVYKVPGAVGLVTPDPEEGVVVYLDTVVHYVNSDEDPSPYTPDTTPAGQLIASAVTDYPTNHDQDEATMYFTGLFPGVDFQANLELTYHGTIPGKINVATILDPGKAQDATLAALWALGIATKDDGDDRVGAWAEGRLSTDDGESWSDPPIDPLGMQLHRNEVAKVTIHVHIPEGNPDYENLPDLGFTGLVTVIQWNEYED